MIPKHSKRGFILINFIMLCMFVMFVTGVIKNLSNKMAVNELNAEVIKIYFRGRDLFHDDIPRGPRVHPILQDEGGIYYELNYFIGEDGKKKIKVLRGNLSDMSKATQNYFDKNIKVDKEVNVDKEKFLNAVETFIEEREGKNYYLLDFGSNSIGFKNYVLGQSNL